MAYHGIILGEMAMHPRGRHGVAPVESSWKRSIMLANVWVKRKAIGYDNKAMQQGGGKFNVNLTIGAMARL
ncbi:hypothetical protein [Chitinophaga defluvii]|uniref:Uncharacterized protein n=1 Tax=Chitinophaga defluvii TaxID=3163343 RepID=A0ABV2TFZ7_9BACT